MGYKVVIEGDVANIIERKTGSDETCIVLTMESEESARKMSRHLNFGGGFDGWTPDFFNLNYKNA